MRKLFYLCFCVALLAGVGCALTDYELITDNDQVKQGFTGPVNTNGKAHIRTFQLATLWGTSNDELIYFVDQKANGDRTITTYNNFSTSADPTFHDDLYCNPDWQGCALWTAHDPPGSASSPAYDGNWNPNCSGARSLYILGYAYRGTNCRTGYICDPAYTYNYGECGRIGAQKLNVWNSGQIGEFAGTTGLWFRLDANTTTLTVNNQLIPVVGANLFLNPTSQQGALDLSHPLTPITLRGLDSATGQDGLMQISLTYNGYTISHGAKKIQDFANAAELRF